MRDQGTAPASISRAGPTGSRRRRTKSATRPYGYRARLGERGALEAALAFAPQIDNPSLSALFEVAELSLAHNPGA
jgi:hypothetical protein